MVCHGQVCVAGVAAPVFRASLVSLILGSLKKASAAASCSSGYWLGPKLGPGFNSCVRASNHLSSLSLHRALAPRGRSSSIKKKIWARFYDAFGHSIVHSTAMRFDLTEHFRRLRRSAGAGPDGCRNEYRTALTAYSLLSSTTPRRLRSCVALTSSPLCWRTLTCRGGSTSLGRDGERIAQGAPAVDGDGASAPAKAAAARFVLGI